MALIGIANPSSSDLMSHVVFGLSGRRLDPRHRGRRGRASKRARLDADCSHSPLRLMRGLPGISGTWSAIGLLHAGHSAALAVTQPNPPLPV